MAQSLQAKKRAKQNTKRRTINRACKSQIKTQIKHLEEVMSSGDSEKASEQYKLIARKLDKTASTSTMHKRRPHERNHVLPRR